jgi:hypothetical protein
MGTHWHRPWLPLPRGWVAVTVAVVSNAAVAAAQPSGDLDPDPVLERFSLVLLGLWLFINFHLFNRENGTKFYIGGGFILITVANGALFLVVHGLVFGSEGRCGGPVGYCGTISCASANILTQGYVFMFFVLVMNAFINLRYLTNARETQKQNLNVRPGIHPTKTANTGLCASNLCRQVLLFCFSTGAARTDDTKIHPYLSKVTFSDRTLMAGVILTTITGILPTIVSSLHPRFTAKLRGLTVPTGLRRELMSGWHWRTLCLHIFSSCLCAFPASELALP